MIDSVLSTAALGLRVNANNAARAAEKIVQSPAEQGGGDADLIGGIVDLNRAKIGFAASAEVLRTGDQMRGQLLDILV